MGFWSSVWNAVSGRGRSSEPPAAREPTYGGSITPNGSETPLPNNPSPEQERIWGGAGANQQEIDTLEILRERFEAWPSFSNWKAYAAAQEDMGINPDWAEFREKYDPVYV